MRALLGVLVLSDPLPLADFVDKGVESGHVFVSKHLIAILGRVLTQRGVLIGRKQLRKSRKCSASFSHFMRLVRRAGALSTAFIRPLHWCTVVADLSRSRTHVTTVGRFAAGDFLREKFLLVTLAIRANTTVF